MKSCSSRQLCMCVAVVHDGDDVCPSPKHVTQIRCHNSFSQIIASENRFIITYYRLCCTFSIWYYTKNQMLALLILVAEHLEIIQNKGESYVPLCLLSWSEKWTQTSTKQQATEITQKSRISHIILILCPCFLTPSQWHNILPICSWWQNARPPFYSLMN